LVIKVNPANLLNAAKGMETYSSPDLKALSDRLSDSYLLVKPGMGLALVAIEAMYNQTCAYHAENLAAGVTAIDSVIEGLRSTANNCKTAEQVNFVGFQGKTTDSDVVSFSDSLWDVESNNASENGVEQFGQVVDTGLMIACLGLAVGCSVISWPFAIVPSLAFLLVANVPSLYSTATDLEEIASSIDNPTLSSFKGYGSAATAGWEDASRPGYEHTVAEIAAEIGQAKESLTAVATFLRAVATALVSFWLALIAFLPPFFSAVAAVAATGVGVPLAEAWGMAAAVGWSGFFTKVLTVIGMLGTLVGATVGASSGLKKFDMKRDNIPDLKQIKIQWTTA
jgi:hypothetical protein